ncbi:transposase [Lichenicola cladoniae]|uniref:Transposase n=1 Tax=Lichenicola cladoniae TaxID=1484109 RepID=A0A6M8HUU7_9PROT|nr:transposase [Acetobacteraceae bacterium]QKE91955.1 transposase [Lichenicola cladoniae]
MTIDGAGRPVVVAGRCPHRTARFREQGQHRCVIERTFSWINRYRSLVLRYERRSDIHHASTALADSCGLRVRSQPTPQ